MKYITILYWCFMTLLMTRPSLMLKRFRIRVCCRPLLFCFYCFFSIVRLPSYIFTLSSTAVHIL